MGKKEWKKLIKKAMPSLKEEPSKLLRKRLPNRIPWIDFSAFFGGSGQSAGSTDKGKVRSKEDGSEQAQSGLATLPPEVPEVRHCLLRFSCTDDLSLLMTTLM